MNLRDDPILAGLAEQHAELDALVRDLDEAGFNTPSRCEGWTIADVLLHLAQTDDMALASLEGRFEAYVEEAAAHLGPAADVDEGVARMVDHERGAPGAEVLHRWRIGADRLRGAFADADPSTRVTWVAGTLAARTLATTRLAECWIHTDDIAAGLGVELPAADRHRHILRLAWRTLPYAFSRAGQELSGPVAFHLDAPDGSTWSFTPDDADAAPTTTIRGDAMELLRVAARRVDPADTKLTGDGPDTDGVLSLIRTWA